MCILDRCALSSQNWKHVDNSFSSLLHPYLVIGSIRPINYNKKHTHFCCILAMTNRNMHLFLLLMMFFSCSFLFHCTHVDQDETRRDKTKHACNVSSIWIEYIDKASTVSRNTKYRMCLIIILYFDHCEIKISDSYARRNLRYTAAYWAPSTLFSDDKYIATT